MDTEAWIWLAALAPVAYVQNMFFTLVSRSRNSKDVSFHRKAAWGSNGVWFACQVMIVKNIWAAIGAGQWWYAILAGIVYAIFTTEGSCHMMRIAIKTEKGDRRVGANVEWDEMKKRIEEIEKKMK